MRPIFNALSTRRAKDGVSAEMIISSGRYLGQGVQDIHEESEVQKYTIGTRVVIDDRVFRYCQAKEALDPLLGARADVMPREGEMDAVAYEVGDTEVTIPMNQYGVDYVAEQVADYWAEGYIWIQTGMQLHRIKSSAVATTTGRVTSLTGGFVTLTLYEGLRTAVAASAWITAWVNHYKVCKHEHSGKMSVVAMPLVGVTINYYFWGQTWGPCFGVQTSTKPGLASGDREVFFGSDGALVTGGDVCNTGLAQKAGFLITNTEPWTNAGNSAEGGGDQFYMLQLSP